MELDSKIFVAGHKGLLGSAIVRELSRGGYKNLILRSSKNLALRNQDATRMLFKKEKPDYVFLAAAKVGGIKANIERPAEFLFDNLQIQNNVINSSHVFEVRKLIFFGSNCAYARDCHQPMKEEYLFKGELEPTNEAYAVAKLAGIKLCQFYKNQHGSNFITAIPASLFGPNDNFNLESSHLIPALIRRFHDAKTSNLEKVVLWGSGKPKREVMFVEEAAQASVFLMNNYDSNKPINVGTGVDYSVRELAEIVKNIIGFKGELLFDASNPDGIPRKLLDSSKINLLGWRSGTKIEDGLEKTYPWFLNNLKIYCGE
jgi:GDP-L-fucose synthase